MKKVFFSYIVDHSFSLSLTSRGHRERCCMRQKMFLSSASHLAVLLLFDVKFVIGWQYMFVAHPMLLNVGVDLLNRLVF